MSQQVGLPGQRQVALKGENHVSKGCIILTSFGAIARQVDVDAAPAQLGTEITEGEQFVCTH